jgi:hypothetical protein
MFILAQIQQAAEKARSERLPFCDKGADIFKVGFAIFNFMIGYDN